MITTRVLQTGLMGMYVALFHYLYVGWGNRYANLGMTLDGEAPLSLLAILMVLGYTVITASRINNYGSFLVEAQFFIIIVPTLLVVAMQNYPPAQRLALMLGLFGAHLLLRFIVRIRVPTVTSGAVRSYGTRRLVLALLILLTIYGFAVYLPYLRLSPLGDVHAHRALVASAVTAPLIGYVLGFLQNAAAPALLAVGIFLRKGSLILLSFAIVMLAYMAIGAKLALAQFLVTAFVAVLVKRSKKLTLTPLIALLTGLLTFSAFLVAVGAANGGNDLWGELSAIIFMRSFALQGAMHGVYYDFFLHNPNTLYTHINFVGTLFEYPYGHSLGIIVGDFLGAEGAMNANAAMWATDGIAAMNLYGLFAIAVVFGIVVIFMKSMLPPEMTRVASCASLPFIMAIGNASLFTNLLTGGGLVLVLLVRFLLERQTSSRERVRGQQWIYEI